MRQQSRFLSEFRVVDSLGGRPSEPVRWTLRSSVPVCPTRKGWTVCSNLIMSVIRLNIDEAVTHLSSLVANLRPGDRIILCSRNREIAEIRPIVEPSDEPRSIDLGKGLAKIPDSFFEPLPDEILDRFEGKLR